MKHLIRSTISLLVFLCALSARAQFQNHNILQVPDDWVEFDYSTSDGGFSLKCSHGRPFAEVNDYQIVCGKGLPAEKRFRAHFLMRRFGQAKAPQDSYQILFWVTDLNSARTQFSSSSQMLQLKNQSDLLSFNISVGVENDAALLTVRSQVPN